MAPTTPVPRDKDCAHIYSYLTDYYDSHGFAPTYKQIAVELAYPSKETVHRHLHHLDKDGLVVIHGRRGAIPAGTQEGPV